MRFWVTGPDALPLGHGRLGELRPLNLVQMTNVLYTARTIGLVARTASEVTQNG